MDIARRSKRGALAALSEVFGVYAAGQLVTFLLCLLFRVPLENPLSGLGAGMDDKALSETALRLGIVLALQAAGWLALAAPLALLYRRPVGFALGLTRDKARPRRTALELALIGVVLFAAADLPGRLANALASLAPAASPPGMLGTLLRLDWSLPGFWLLTGVGSFGLVPLLEELFYRGYCQRRLVEGLGAPAGVAATALLFTFSHGQYLSLDAANLTALGGILVSALAAGIVAYKTGSILPCIVAHALVNVPLPPGSATWIQLGAMAACAALGLPYLKRAYAFLAGMKGQARRALPALSAAGLAVAGFTLAWHGAQDAVLIAGIPLLLLSLVGLGKKRRVEAEGGPEGGPARTGA